MIKTFVLTGALEGRTIRLGSQPYSFVEGRLSIDAPANQMKLHARFLARNWQAYPEEEVQDGKRNVPSDSQRDGQHAVQGDDEPKTAAGLGPDARTGSAGTQAGGTGALPDGNGQEARVNAKLRRAVMSLDPEDDGHWTFAGLPSMKAVEALYGSAAITRADVEEAAPGYTRPGG